MNKSCPNCKIEFKPKRKEQQYCSRVCGNSSVIRAAKISKTWSTMSVSRKRKIRAKQEKTSLANWGTKNPSQCKKIIRKIKKVSLERYGYDNPAKAPEIRKRISEGLRNSSFDRSAHGKRVYKKRKKLGKPLAGCVDKATRDATYLERYGCLGFGYSHATLKDEYGWKDKDLEWLSEARTFTLNKCIEKYGIREGKRYFKDVCDSKSLRLENWIKRYGKREGNKLYKLWRENFAQIAPSRASKESLKIFIPLYKFCIKLGIPKEGVYFGYKDHNEWFINNGEKLFFYDFAIPNLNLILEYHGEGFHPNPNWDKEFWKTWRQPYSKAKAAKVYELDCIKKQVALDKDFQHITIWSSSPTNVILAKGKTLIKELFDGTRKH